MDLADKLTKVEAEPLFTAISILLRHIVTEGQTRNFSEAFDSFVPRLDWHNEVGEQVFDKVGAEDEAEWDPGEEGLQRAEA